MQFIVMSTNTLLNAGTTAPKGEKEKKKVWSLDQPISNLESLSHSTLR
jgi:hypothetical protein